MPDALLVTPMAPTVPANAVPNDAPVRAFSPPVPARLITPVLPLLVTLERLRLEKIFLLLRLVTQAGLGRTDARLGLAFPLLVSGAQIRGPLFFQFGFPRRGPIRQFRFALLEFCKEGEFLLLQFLPQARFGFARFGVALAFQLGLQTAQLLLRLRLHVP